MRNFAVCVMGFGLAFGVTSSAFADDKDKVKIDQKDADGHYKETTKIKEKHGKVKGESKVESTDADGNTEKTKMKTKNGKTKIKTETKENPEPK